MSHHNVSMSVNVAAGGIAGVTEILIMYPLDVVKTRAQLYAGKTNNPGIVGTVSEIVKANGVKGLYRGILPPILMEAPKRAVKFTANAFFKKHFTGSDGVLSQTGAVLSGSCAGITEAFVVVPFELVKIRLQAKENLGLYKNTSDALTKIIKQEGIMTLYTGLESTMWRNATWNGGYFGLIHAVKSAMPKPNSEGQRMFQDFVAGFLSGTFGTMLNTPFDVAKTRIQNQLPGTVHKYNWTLPALAKIYSEEGVKALYKGFVPKVLRLGPGGGVLLLVFNFAVRFMSPESAKH
ncbi:mitochondrial carrier protein [Naegleria gruberi]|uniref:Mitochondrial carrier protein n=1 Tax=Naegleria gruberi TaxID=5762 RepID=D2VCL7_NAEGR|nr:mitochondrial carrier protein [Naegleria gruberi]EFC45440.1 mitochondrial carrier protein [Naegleria gruberi]|eukprot:XP_002678184.1 mitochondrial carrier protein [Naegleria gruberi strain NEG-M]